MKKLVYILIAFVVFLSFTAVSVFAGEIDKAKEAEKIFANEIAQESDIDLNIDAQNVSAEEMKSVVGERYHDLYYRPSSWDRMHGGYDYKQAAFMDATFKIIVIVSETIIDEIAGQWIKRVKRIYKRGKKIIKIITEYKKITKKK